MSTAAASLDNAPLLEVRELVKTFGAVRAVDGISFKIQPGQTVSLIGPNGSGKTSTLNLISGVLKPQGGQILLQDQRIDGLRPERLAELGIARTFQNGRVFGNMSIRDNVLVGMHTQLHAARPFASLRHIPVLRWISLLGETVMAVVQPPSVRREEEAMLANVQEELKRFEQRLLPRQDRFAYTLSYANRRRTEIARALALRPRLLLLDEPTAGMNPTETAEVLEQLLELRAAGQSMLLVEHKLDLVMKLSDHVLVMDGGKLIAQGRPEAIQEDERVIETYIGRRRSLVG
ncbi:ABC transporter ATP-binding protein [Ktedonosporobacter rubrisoli]|uniref:ABC transporter ATP-binding protein n=1 Tax=Ktedonosporobacter rubrisoli TaxID=2509675 RepID=A0A4P6K076_KTERU|nr:ATP-binding cassette domain-containing protein [Ktedonosporobacter rubrisoli]QBD80796.1 ABC transporter ATP-binding protein [Ktedonosporobacter rubrisoli]